MFPRMKNRAFAFVAAATILTLTAACSGSTEPKEGTS